MTFFLLVFAILIVHFSFFLQLYISGDTQISFFGFISEFNYTKQVADECLIYIFLCTIALIIGYTFSLTNKRFIPLTISQSQPNNIQNIRSFFRISCIIQIAIVLIVIIKGGGNYQKMASVRESMNFLFELRIFPLLAFVYLLQFISKKTVKEYRSEIILFSTLMAFFVIVQARSLLVESGCVLGYYFCKKNKDKIKIKYIVILYILSIVPNLIVLGRLTSEQSDLTNIETWKNIFTYEYTILFNNIVAEVISSTKDIDYGVTIIPSLGLLFPSFIREFLGISIHKDLLNTIAINAGVLGGGFSMFAELYLNFGWLSLIIFYFMGLYLAKLDSKWFTAKTIPLKYAMIPIIFSYILLGLRNDLGVLIKQIIQIHIAFFIIQYIVKVKIHHGKSIGR